LPILFEAFEFESFIWNWDLAGDLQVCASAQKSFLDVNRSGFAA
jgi:hypothetical protein